MESMIYKVFNLLINYYLMISIFDNQLFYSTPNLKTFKLLILNKKIKKLDNAKLYIFFNLYKIKLNSLIIKLQNKYHIYFKIRKIRIKTSSYYFFSYIK